MSYPRMAQVKSPEQFRARLASAGAELPFDDHLESGPESPLARAYAYSGGSVGNRFAILPMEGWDGEADGRPSDLTRRRWQNFGRSGAKLIWGGEAVAVRHDGRANPQQLVIAEHTLTGLEQVRQELLDAHAAAFGRTDDLLIGLQLTHSGRFARPNPGGKLESKILYHHPILEARYGLAPDTPLMSDDEIARLIDDFVIAAQRAAKLGFSFIDIKHCHGYLGHEFLSAVDRPGRYGGSFENRTRFLREIVAGVKAVAPGLGMGVRLSAIDFLPYQPGPDGVGVPSAPPTDVRLRPFGSDATGREIDLTEPHAFMALLEELGVDWVCTTAGSPYYNPHFQRPAAFPPSDGYQPPEDPLVGVARQVRVTAELKQRHPRLAFVGSGYTYLQEWLPRVGQRVVRDGGVDFIGLGRMVLSYPEMPADVLAGRELSRTKVCRTFSDCTTAPRNGLVSGCYPLDPFYKQRPEAVELGRIKKARGE